MLIIKLPDNIPRIKKEKLLRFRTHLPNAFQTRFDRISNPISKKGDSKQIWDRHVNNREA